MRPYKVKDPARYWDEKVLLTDAEAWTWVEVPPVPLAYTDTARQHRTARDAAAALAGLRQGPVRMVTAYQPLDLPGWQQARDKVVRAAGRPGKEWPRYVAGETARIRAVGATAKHTYLGYRLGARPTVGRVLQGFRRGPVPAAPDAEISRWHKEADRVRGLLASSALQATGIGADQLRGLRRHVLWRGTAPDTATGRTRWGKDEIADEWADLELRPGLRTVAVNAPTGAAVTATFVLSQFPMIYQFGQPWLAALDRLGLDAEVSLAFDLIPPKDAVKHLTKKYRAAKDQEQDARRAGSDLPIETLDVIEQARQMEYLVPQENQPLAYGWAMVRVDADTEDGVRERYDALKQHFAGLGMDLAWPGGHQQVGLLCGSVPGFGPGIHSYNQKWGLETVGAALPHAASGLSHSGGGYRGWTTGDVRQAVTWDPHSTIRVRERKAHEHQAPSGFLLLGEQRGGKSSALSSLLAATAIEGLTGLAIDPSGPLGLLENHPWLAGQVRTIDLLAVGGGVADPLGPVLIPGDATRSPAVRAERMQLAQQMFTTLAWEHVRTGSKADEAEGELLRAITAVAEHNGASSLQVIERLRKSQVSAGRTLGEVLAFALSSGGVSEAMFGDGVKAVHTAPVTIITCPGLVLPLPGTKVADMNQWERQSAAFFANVCHLAVRMLWKMPSNHLKVLTVDEAHIALATDSGRRAIEGALRDGPKHGVATGLATHNAADVGDERLTNAVSTVFQFRSTDDAELTNCLRVARIEDTEANRDRVRNLRNGECIARFPDDTRDRFRWDLWVPGLAELASTTPTGLAEVVA